MTQSILLSLRNNWKYLIILSALLTVYFLLYCAGIFYIQFILFFASAALFPVLIVHEKNNMKNQQLSHNFSEDERWSKTKSAIEKLSDRIDKTKNQAERRSLQTQKLSLETELRRLEWKLKESDMTQMYNAARGNLRRLDDSKSVTEGSVNEGEQLESEKRNRSFLLKVVKTVEKILTDEPPTSVREALAPIMNDLRAHYNILKKRRHDDAILSDYFVTWATLSSFVRGSIPDKRLLGYASSGFRRKLGKLQDQIRSLPQPITLSSNLDYQEDEAKTELDN